MAAQTWDSALARAREHEGRVPLVAANIAVLTQLRARWQDSVDMIASMWDLMIVDSDSVRSPWFNIPVGLMSACLIRPGEPIAPPLKTAMRGMPSAEAFSEVVSSVRLISTVAEYQRLAMIGDHASRLRAWTADYEAAHRDVFDVYYRSYSAPSDRDNAVADVAKVAPLVREREARAEALARQTECEFRALGLLDELNVVLLVGNSTANAWVDDFHGQPAMFVALELMGAPPYDGMLFSHEAVHLAHMHQGAASWPDDVGSHLIQEGVATAASRETHPGQSDSGYLWNDDRHDSWVRECREAERALITVVLDEMATPAEASHVEGLFAPDCQAAMLPPRSGYWLGDLLAQRWLSQHSLRDVLRWNHAEATDRATNDLRARVNP